MSKPIALVTGATRGLGAAIADELAATHHIIVGGTNPETVAEAVERFGDASPFVADLRDDEALASAAGQISELDVLVHNAGIEMSPAVEEATREQWREIFEVNVFAVAELTRLLLPALRERHGHLIAINSGSGYRSGKNAALYSGSKFALRALTDAIREEEAGRVRVTSIHPGRADTDMQRTMWERDGVEYDGSLWMRPESVAKAVRLAVDTTSDANIDELQIRPTPR